MDRLLAEKHPYTLMWENIREFYDTRDLGDLCDESLESQLNQMATKGFSGPDAKFVAPVDIANSAKRWNDYGWYDYEKKRASKYRKTKKWGKTAALFVLAGIGIPMIGEGG